MRNANDPDRRCADAGGDSGQRIIGKRLQEVQQRVREFATQSAERRVAHTMLRLAHQAGHDAMDGTTIDFPLRRKDVADIAGVTLHTASRILTGWERAGIVASRNQKLTICRPTQILRIAEAETDTRSIAGNGAAAPRGLTPPR